MLAFVVEGGVIQNAIELSDNAKLEDFDAFHAISGKWIGDIYEGPTPAEQLRADVDYLAALQGVIL